MLRETWELVFGLPCETGVLDKNTVWVELNSPARKKHRVHLKRSFFRERKNRNAFAVVEAFRSAAHAAGLTRRRAITLRQKYVSHLHRRIQIVPGMP